MIKTLKHDRECIKFTQPELNYLIKIVEGERHFRYLTLNSDDLYSKIVKRISSGALRKLRARRYD